MASGRESGKRILYGYDEADEDSLFVSQTARKKAKSEVPESFTSDDPERESRDSRVDQDESEEEPAVNEDEHENVAADQNEAVDEDEEEDDDVEDDEDALYSEKQESFPDHPAFDQQIPEVQESLAKLAENALASVHKTPCDTAQVNELRRMALSISAIPECTKQTIGLIGEAGQGKSSLVNSLCDCPNLAKALDAGKSCTYVITKYERAGPKQKLDFSFGVEFYDSSTIAFMLSEALDDWHTFVNKFDHAWTQEEVAQHESRATTCLSTFRAIFSSYPDFETDEIATDTLNILSRSELSMADKVKNLVERAEEVLQAFTREDGLFVYYREAENTEDLWESLEKFVTASPDPDKPAPWPLVKHVSVGVRGPRLLDFYVLVDMPGISDTNEVRVEATEQFSKQCDYLVIVARAGRVTTDPLVRSVLRNYGKALAGNVIVVGTKSDHEAGHAEAVGLEKLGFNIGKDYHNLKALSDQMASELNALKHARRKSTRNSSNCKSLDSMIDEIQKEKRLIDSSRKEPVVRAWNIHNANSLRKTSQHYLPAGKKLHVFGVSNQHYERLINDGCSGDYQLSPAGTGIPALRQHLLGFAAPRTWNALKDFISSDITALIPSFEMWAGTGSLASGRVALVIVTERHRLQLKSDFEGYQRILIGLVDQIILTAFRSHQRSSAAAAVNYVQLTLSICPWSHLRAFIKRNGQHKTRLMADSWNQQLTTLSTRVIEKAWVSFKSDREALVQAMNGKIVSAVEAIPKSLRTGLRGVSESSMATFEQSLEGRISGMQRAIGRHDEGLVKELQAIYINSTIDNADNYFTNAMREAYETCRRDSGTGIKARSLSVLKTHLSLAGERSPFAQMLATMKRKIQAVIQAHVAGIHADLDTSFKAILGDVKYMASNKSEHASEKWVRRDVARFVQSARPMLDDIKDLVQSIESRYPAESLG